MSEQNKEMEVSEKELQAMIAEADSGSRNVTGISGKIMFGVPLAWALFQLWYASPLPFLLRFGVFNDTEARSIHLAFAMFLTYTAYPALKRSPRSHIPIQDWIMAVIGAFCTGYLYLFYEQLANRAGAPTTFDLIVAGHRDHLITGSYPKSFRTSTDGSSQHLSLLHFFWSLYARCHCTQRSQLL